MSLPPDLPVPEDDGAADHLAGMKSPELTLINTAGEAIHLDALGDGRSVIYIYPLTGRPGHRPP
jgi:peroxiredoxin